MYHRTHTLAYCYLLPNDVVKTSIASLMIASIYENLNCLHGRKLDRIAL